MNTIVDALLCRLVGPSASEQAIDRIRALDTSEWNQLVLSATRHRVASLLHARLHELGLAEIIPSEQAQVLDQAWVEVGDQNRLFYSHLEEVCRSFQAEDIDSLILKGPHIAMTVYHDLAKRHFWDLDILVPRIELWNAERVLLDMGFGPKERTPIEIDIAWNLHIFPFRKEGGRITFEIHWTIEQPSSPFTITVEELWAGAEPWMVGNIPVKVLNRDHLFVHLCLHAAYHHGFDVRIKHLCDIAWLVAERDPSSWQAIVELARTWKANRMVAACLHVVEVLFGVSPPAGVLELLVEMPVDVSATPLIIAHVFRAADRGSKKWLVTRRPLTQWLYKVTGRNIRDTFGKKNLAAETSTDS